MHPAATPAPIERATETMKVGQLEKTAHFRQIEQHPLQRPGQTQDGTAPFARVLEGKLARANHQVKFSAHAADRLASRNIVLTDRDLSLLDSAVTRAAAKGGKESLVVMDHLSFVVNVDNRTVITAMQNRTGGADKVFTKIDSAVIV